MSTQEGITYVDLYNTMMPDAATLIGSDGLHPTEAGYRRIAELFFAAISPSSKNADHKQATESQKHGKLSSKRQCCLAAWHFQ